jgi:hypothetical protein
MQAMIPPEVKKEQKKKEKQQDKDKARSVSFAPDLRGSLSREGYAEPREPPVRNAMEYQPPNSFVQTVQKPLPDKKQNILADLWNYT